MKPLILFVGIMCNAIFGYGQNNRYPTYFEKISTVDYVVSMFTSNFDSIKCYNVVDSFTGDSGSLYAFPFSGIVPKNSVSIKTARTITGEKLKEIRKILSDKETYANVSFGKNNTVTQYGCTDLLSNYFKLIIFFKSNRPALALFLNPETHKYDLIFQEEKEYYFLKNSCMNSYKMSWLVKAIN